MFEMIAVHNVEVKRTRRWGPLFFLYGFCCTLPVWENEALMLQPGEAITKPLQALLRSGTAS